MKLPRFSLRALFVLIALIGIPIAWVAYQLNWIRERHEFLATHRRHTNNSPSTVDLSELPWALRVFGEKAEPIVEVETTADQDRAMQLFPEATILRY